jgi:hypothetical protein
METHDHNLFREAAIDAIKKHQKIIKELQEIVALNYSDFKITDKEGNEIKNLATIEFVLFNIKDKVRKIKADEEDIKTCYKQMEIFE